MKKQTLWTTSLALSLILTACSSTPKNENQSDLSQNDLVTLEEALTDRALAESVSSGLELVRLIELAATSAEKQALLSVTQTVAKQEGIQLAKLTLSNYTNALKSLTKFEAARITYAISKSSNTVAKQVFAKTEAANILKEAELLVVGTPSGYRFTSTSTGGKTYHYSSNGNTTAVSGSQPAFNAEQRAYVKKLYEGFNKDKRFVKVAVNYETLTGAPFWDFGTCTTLSGFKNPVAISNTREMGEAALVAANSAKLQGYTGKVLENCAIKRSGVAVAKYASETLNIPNEEITAWAQQARLPCKLLPENVLPAVAAAAAQGNLANTDPSQVSCN